MADIFISYAREDETRIRGLVRDLEKHGWSIFWDRRIPAGKTWQSYIGRALSEAKCVIVAWSHHSITSEWVIEEAKVAKRRGVIVPVRLDNVDPPFGFTSIQAADLTDWKPGYSSPHLDQLIEDIEAVVGAKPQRPTPAELVTPRTEPVATFRAIPTEPPAHKPALSKPPPQRTFTNSLGMSFVLIPAGSFIMGSPPDEPEREEDERQHPVTISKPFYLQTTEVTQKQWTQVMGSNLSSFKNCGDKCPVDSVSWNDAQEFIKKLNQKESGARYRLPTEAEWEYACRAGSKGRFSFGDEEAKLEKYAWYWDNSGKETHPVGKKKPNAWGLYDMHGNVSEWCQDCHGDYPASQVTDPAGPKTGEYRVIRGGSWGSGPRLVRASGRYGGSADGRCDNIGFRLAQDIE